MKLYYVPMTRSTRPRWILEELGVPHELVRLDVKSKENKRPEYTALNPLGHVPTLVDGDVTVYESAAICMYLADKYLEKQLAPPPGSKERALYYQWMIFGMATVEPAIVTYAQHTRGLPESERSAAESQRARTRFQDVAGVLQKAVAGKQFLVGDRFSAADIIVCSMLGWANSMKMLDELPELATYAKGMLARPAAKKARED
jgi:glutathione S-transferase